MVYVYYEVHDFLRSYLPVEFGFTMVVQGVILLFIFAVFISSLRKSLIGGEAGGSKDRIIRRNVRLIGRLGVVAAVMGALGTLSEIFYYIYKLDLSSGRYSTYIVMCWIVMPFLKLFTGLIVYLVAICSSILLEYRIGSKKE